MPDLDDRLHTLSGQSPDVPPPTVAELRVRARSRRHRRTLAAATLLAMVVAGTAVTWALTIGGSDGNDGSTVVAGQEDDVGTSAPDPCDDVPPVSSDSEGLPLDDPLALACLALDYYGNDEAPAEVRFGTVDLAAFDEWQRQQHDGGGPTGSIEPGTTATAILVRTSGGPLVAPHPPASASGDLAGDTIYAVITGDSLTAAINTGTATWSDLLDTPWTADLEELDLPNLD